MSFYKTGQIHEYVHTDNKWHDRKGHSISGIVIHTCDGVYNGCRDWCANPTSQVSYHYIVREDGEVANLVGLNEAAWHSGAVMNPTWSGYKQGENPNLYTVGISMSGFGVKPKTWQQRLSVCALIALSAMHANIPINKHTVVWHREIHAGKTCPGYNVYKTFFISVARFYRFMYENNFM